MQLRISSVFSWQACCCKLRAQTAPCQKLVGLVCDYATKISFTGSVALLLWLHALRVLWRLFPPLPFPGIQSLEPGTITVGMVAKMIPHIGLTITLPGGKAGKVSIFHLSDKYTESPLSDFKIGKVVRSVTPVVLCCSRLRNIFLSGDSFFTTIRWC